MMKVQFEATIDDCVDVSQRILARSKTVSSWRSRDLVITALATGIFSYALSSKLVVGIIGAVVSGVIYLPIRRIMIKQRLRKYLIETFKSDGPVNVQVELTPDGIHTRQSGTQSIYDRENVEIIRETDDSVDFFLKQGGGGLVVRKRAFISTEQMRQFVALADEYRKQKAGHTDLA